MWAKTKQHLLVGTVLLMILLVTTAVPVLGFWQATYFPFDHSDPFGGTVNGGQQDAAVDYPSSSERNVWSEGAHLTWTQSAIDYLKNGIYCRDNFCNPKIWYEAASTYHAFNKNSTTCNALRWRSGWAWTNLPGPSFSSEDSGCQLRVYIQDPYSMSASATYYSQMTYGDTAYNGTIKTNGEVTYATYYVQIGGVVPIPINRDHNAKLCINDNTAAVPINGSCP